jgi:hypothetical protein
MRADNPACIGAAANIREKKVRVASITVLVAAVFLLVNAVTAQQQPATSVLELMKSVVIPASDVVFGVGKAAPKTDQEWSAVHGSAGRLIDAAKLLAMQTPPAGGADWVKYSQAMSDAAATAGRAASAKNTDAVLDAGDVLYGTCEDCHRQYMKK